MPARSDELAGGAAAPAGGDAADDFQALRIDDVELIGTPVGKVEAISRGVRLGEDYPLPLVEHAQARQGALAAWERVRGRQA